MLYWLYPVIFGVVVASLVVIRKYLLKAARAKEERLCEYEFRVVKHLDDLLEEMALNDRYAVLVASSEPDVKVSVVKRSASKKKRIICSIVIRGDSDPESIQASLLQAENSIKAFHARFAKEIS
jgi:hypothetical protein